MKILDVRWFCGHSNVGIVRVEDPYEGIRYYVGSCTGIDENADKEHIAAWGSSFPDAAGDVLFDIREGGAA
jgi:hypothetical protein